jgi:5-methylcytosine-specific restriction endonuclease McrA
MAPRRRRELTDAEESYIQKVLNLQGEIWRELMEQNWEETERTEFNGGLFSDEVKRAAWDASEGECQRCGITVVPGIKGPDGVAYDHIRPWNRRGSGSERNCQVLCTACNRSKNDSMEAAGAGEGESLDEEVVFRLRRLRDRLIQRCLEPPPDLPEPDPTYDHQRPLG